MAGGPSTDRRRAREALAAGDTAPGDDTGARMRNEHSRLLRAAVWVGVAFAITLLCWRQLPLQPTPGLDRSWEAALHMALHEGVTFGNHLAFTYGPLGFLSVPTLWYSDTGALAVFYAFVVHFLIVLALFAGARRTFGTVGGALVALVVVDLSEIPLETVPFLILAVWIVDRVSDRRRRLAWLAVAGGVAGLELLDKQSVGIATVALAIIAAFAAQGRRRENLLVTFGALLVALLAGWVATGQSLGVLPEYVTSSKQVISGYAAAQGLTEPGLEWEYAAGLLAFAIGLVGALQMTADGPARRRWGIVALWVVFCFFEYKEAFVLHEPYHGAIFFVALMGGFLAIRWRWRAPWVGLVPLGVLCTLAVVAELSFFEGLHSPLARVNLAVTEILHTLSPSKRASITEKGRRIIQEAYPIDQATLSELQGHTVHVAPYQTSVAWAYHLHWQPLPAFQSYVAYTTALDQDNANDLNSANAPQRILRDIEEDGIQPDEEVPHWRLATFNEGLATRAMLCRYTELSSTRTWQVLALGPNRCGPTVHLSTVHAAWHQKVRVPAPPNNHSFVFARIGGVNVGGTERIVALLYKPAERVVLLNGVSHGLVEETAADGLLVRAAPAADYKPPANLAPNSTTIAIAKVGGGAGGGTPLTYTFYAQSINR